MSAKSDQIVKLLNELKPKVIVETGTIRNVSKEHEQGDGHSTRFIAEWVKENGGEFISIDLKTSVCSEYLKMLGLAKYVILIEGNSLDVLPRLGEIDFCYLDSENSPELILNEYKLVKSKVVMIDDCIEGSSVYRKGELLIPYLREQGINFDSLPTGQIVIRWTR